jgi:hypothetical protein
MSIIHTGILRTFIMVAIGILLLAALLPVGQPGAAGEAKAVFGVA